MIFISARDELFASEISAHTGTKWTFDGKLAQTWGTPNVPDVLASTQSRERDRSVQRRQRFI